MIKFDLNKKHPGCKKRCGQELINGHAEKDVKSNMGSQGQRVIVLMEIKF